MDLQKLRVALPANASTMIESKNNHDNRSTLMLDFNLSNQNRVANKAMHKSLLIRLVTLFKKTTEAQAGTPVAGFAEVILAK